MSRGVDAGVGPADTRPHRPWPTARIILAYLVLLALAVGSIWLIDRRVDEMAHRPTGVTR